MRAAVRTSSPVVGSSAISSAARSRAPSRSSPLAHPAGELVGVLPRARRSGSGCRPGAASRWRACGSRPSTGRMDPEQPGDLLADRDPGLSDVRGVWAIMAIWAPRMSQPRPGPPGLHRSRLLEDDAAAGSRRPACGSGCRIAVAVTDLPSRTRPPGPGFRRRAPRSSAPSTASISPWSLAKRTLRSSTATTGAFTTRPCADRGSRARRRRPG